MNFSPIRISRLHPPPYLSLSVSRLNGDWKHFQTRFWDNLRFPKLIGFTAPIHSVFFCSLSLTYLLSLSHWFIFNRTSNWITPMASRIKSGESFENWGWEKLTSTAGRVFTIAASSYFHYSPFFELFSINIYPCSSRNFKSKEAPPPSRNGSRFVDLALLDGWSEIGSCPPVYCKTQQRVSSRPIASPSGTRSPGIQKDCIRF